MSESCFEHRGGDAGHFQTIHNLASILFADSYEMFHFETPGMFGVQSRRCEQVCMTNI